MFWRRRAEPKAPEGPVLDGPKLEGPSLEPLPAPESLVKPAAASLGRPR